MKLKEFSIIRYGPLSNTGRKFLHSFNLFWGRNEDGKTLTIDALVKFLLGKKAKKYKFSRIDRVEEEPEGYIILEGPEGDEFKIPERGRLTDLTELTPSVCRNIFIIRDSDLRIESEKEFYTDVTDRLTGLRTERISSIKKELKDLGRLTRPDSQSSLSNSQDYNYISSRLDEASGLIQKIDQLQQEMKRKDFDQLVERYVQAKERFSEVEKELEDLEKAAKRDRYEKGKKALDKLKEAVQKSKDLGVYNEKDQQKWRDRLRSIRDAEEKKKELKAYAEQKEKEREDLKRKIENKKRELDFLNKKRNYVLHHEIKERMNDYEKLEQGLSKREGISRFFSSVGMIAGILTGISGLGVVFHPSPWFWGFSGLFFWLTVVCFGLELNQVRKKGKQREKRAMIGAVLSRYRLDAESVGKMRMNIQQLEDDCREKSQEINQLTARKDSVEDSLEDLKKKKIPEKEEETKKAQWEIDEIQKSSGAETLEEYKNNFQRKQKLEREIESQKILLQNFFSHRGANEEENIHYWENKLMELSHYKDEVKDVEDNDKKREALKEEKNSLSQRIDEMEKRMDRFHRELDSIEREVQKVLRTEDSIPCETSLDLDEVKKRLQSFIQTTQSYTLYVLKVMGIFEEVEKEEREKVSQLFGRDSRVSEYFKNITDGLYEEVCLNPETGKIEVKRKDGKVLDAPRLSAGTYDQLYFSIRLSLGEKLLKDQKGFFIMDDPFVKADSERLKRLLETLKRICGMGWQILYFTAKQEVRETLSREIQDESIQEVEIRLW
ncbi:AAA family ATPase [bacterium]|nr:AAA family ATPase [bacterium]